MTRFWPRPRSFRIIPKHRTRKFRPGFQRPKMLFKSTPQLLVSTTKINRFGVTPGSAHSLLLTSAVCCTISDPKSNLFNTSIVAMKERSSLLNTHSPRTVLLSPQIQCVHRVSGNALSTNLNSINLAIKYYVPHIKCYSVCITKYQEYKFNNPNSIFCNLIE